MPLPPSLLQACQGLGYVGIDLRAVESVLANHTPRIRAKINQLGLSDYREDFGLAICLYTTQEPQVYKVVNAAMFSPGRVSGNNLSRELTWCLPFIKFLDTALERLGNRFKYLGECYRGVKYVYPSPDNHDPVARFWPGRTFYWCEFKSSSRDPIMMGKDNFCGYRGPRTIFAISSRSGYQVEEFSCYGGEQEVLFRPSVSFK
eukprot:c17256_g1_i1.p1 GENE.c17256_g1_i1~~c17256_g1_i1.p1  ORF type:complete len:203 (+),score=21.18 c17256_g1_i1:665-1273(+)